MTSITGFPRDRGGTFGVGTVVIKESVGAAVHDQR
jgi:hypothetical protein